MASGIDGRRSLTLRVDLDVDRDLMLSALDAWGIVYSDGTDIRYGDRQWCRLPGVSGRC